MDTFGVTFTPENHARYAEALRKAQKRDKETFDFEGKNWLVEYAVILTAFLDGVFLTGRGEYKSDQ